METKKESKRMRAMRALQNKILTKHGSKEVAGYFIATVSWNKLIHACEELEIKI